MSGSGLSIFVIGALALLVGCGEGSGPPGESVRQGPHPREVAAAVRRVPPVRDRVVSAEHMRRAILQGAAEDYLSGTQAGPPRFGLCLQSGLERLLDRQELDRLAMVYRRPAGQQFTAQALNALVVPIGDRCGGRRFVPELINASIALRVGRLEPRPTRGLQVAYGPYIGIACHRPNSIRCDRVGFDVLLRRRAVAVGASVAGRSLRLTSLGPVAHNANAPGRDWSGYLREVGLEREGSPFYIPANGRARGLWGGSPPVYLPVRILATYSHGRRASVVFPDVFLSPGFG